MVFITFIYRIDKKTYYGKHVASMIIDDHEGLDLEVRDNLLFGINAFRKKNGLSELKNIMVGVMSYSYDNFTPCYSSKEEIACFDYYCDEKDWNNPKIYVNGIHV